ncbi:KpsF/GutQ family sugar-phosphate isomerase [Candidatus Marinimicrobia bacterium]|nr:KpsF/GutQ family sugar-phosphate isomerase [Candidatus Neomarinimicrobiota bacterium]
MGKKEINGLSQSIFESYSSQLLQVSKNIDQDIQSAAELIINNSGKVVVCGLGKSGLIGQKIVATLCSTGTRSVYMHAAEAIHGDLGIYNPGDPTILISKSGNTEELVRLVPILKEFQSPLIAIVGNMDSFIAKNSDIVLNGTVEKEIDPLGVVPTTSSLVALAIGDALASVLMVQRGFDKKDFARNHPGGELGKQLALKVESVMHPLNDVAQIDENDSISSCASKMTNKPLGAALHLDNDILKGIVTEGDLRKSIASTSDLSNSILDFINNKPISINPSISILDAMKVMEDRHSQISCLPVIDSDGKCLGLVTLHDLYQTKLV